MQNQLIELQRTTASLAIRLEELNNSLMVMQEAVEANRQDLDQMRQEFQRPQVIIGRSTDSPSGFVDPSRPRGLAGISLGDSSAAPALGADRAGALSGQDALPAQQGLPAGPYQDPGAAALTIGSGGETGRQSDPQADAAFDKAVTLFDSKDHGLAIFELNSLIRRYPQSDKVPRAQYLLGECYFELKDWSQALNEYAKVLSAGYDTQIQDSLFKIGLCYEYLGNSARARAAYEKLLQRFPGSEQAAAARGRLEGLR